MPGADTATDPRGSVASTPGALIEVGWVLDGRLEEVDHAAARAAAEDARACMAETFPRFEWRMPIVERELVQAPREAPVRLLETASLELAMHHWDFAVVVTGSDLESQDTPFAWAVPSRALGAAVLSTFRIDPNARRVRLPQGERRDAIRRRLVRLFTLAFGHLNGLPIERSGAGAMVAPSAERELDSRASYDEPQRAVLAGELERVGDERVEEEHGAREHGALGFHVRAAWRNRREIFDLLARNRWWRFPLRMGRLTTAAVSALAVLLLTAESWEVGARQGGGTVLTLALGAIGATAIHVLRRQRLLAPTRPGPPTERAVAMRVSVTLVIVAGVATTYLLLLVAGFALSALLFEPALVERWTSTGASTTAYARQAAVVASIAILVGALGASFEGQTYVKHVAWVDDEI